MIRSANRPEDVYARPATLQDSGVVPVSPRAQADREKPQGARGGLTKATAPTVLLVDSSVTARIELRGALHAAGFAVTACNSRGSALLTLRDRRFDLIVVDVVLQDGNGIELVRILQSMPATATIPLILLVTDKENERVRDLELGPDEIVQKPFASVDLVKRAKRIVFPPGLTDASARVGSPRGCWPIEGGERSSAPPSEPPHPPANAVWRNRDDVPPGSLLHQVAILSGIASVIGPTTVARACKRAGVDVGASSPAVLERALPALRDTLHLFLREADTERRIQKMAELLRAAA